MALMIEPSPTFPVEQVSEFTPLVEVSIISVIDRSQDRQKRLGDDISSIFRQRLEPALTQTHGMIDPGDLPLFGSAAVDTKLFANLRENLLVISVQVPDGLARKTFGRQYQRIRLLSHTSEFLLHRSR